MKRAGSTTFRKRERGFVPGRLAVGLALGASAVALGSIHGCPGDANLCDPSIFPDGVNDYEYIELCTDPDAGSDAADASDTGDAAADAPIGIPPCTGECAPLGPLNWEPPVLVWIGPENEAPPCPEAALKLAYEGHADLQATSECGTCQCDAPTGNCNLPTTLTVSSMACPGDSPAASQTPFNPPTSWEGGCTTHDAVPGGQLCDGDLCAQSLTIGPLVMHEGSCTPTQTSAPGPTPATWSTYARACAGESYGSCGKSALRCVPPTPPAFRRCIYKEGEQSCSAKELAPYTEKHVFYASIHDTRSCSPCTCGSPAGSACYASVSVFDDAACASPPAYVSTIDASGPACLDLIAGAALGSKSASPTIFAPGACEPAGGEPTGAAEPADPLTFCCEPVL